MCGSRAGYGYVRHGSYVIHYFWCNVTAVCEVLYLLVFCLFYSGLCVSRVVDWCSGRSGACCGLLEQSRVSAIKRLFSQAGLIWVGHMYWAYM